MNNFFNQVIDLKYFGNINYYLYLFNSTYVKFEQYVNYDKRSCLNRCMIAGPNGPISLVVPLRNGRTQRTIFKDVVIFNEDHWQKRHWKSIVSCYSAAPWFANYTDSLSELYLRSFPYLLDWNLACLEWSMKQLNLQVNYDLTEEYISSYSDAGFKDLRNIHGSKADYEEDLFIRYKQVFEDKTGFIPNLSILDILLCEGPTNTRSLFSGVIR